MAMVPIVMVMMRKVVVVMMVVRVNVNVRSCLRWIHDDWLQLRLLLR